ncbi:MAG: LptF/LptG family permease [Pirellulaceae bacterium]|nr:LptF/LptG family permease [Pirellulaceae bacterium]
MPILHRYVLRLFIKVLLVAFISLTGLFIVIDAFNNLEEFLTYSKTQGWYVLVDYYGPRVLTFFDRISGMLGMMATMFAITSMQRSNETTAVMAGGISQLRLVKPLVAGVLAVSLLAAANREFLIPRFREKLARNAQDWLGDTARTLHPRYDHQTRILISGRHTFAAERRISFPKLRLPESLAQFGRHLAAESATYRDADGDRPAGYLLDGVEQPANLAELPSAALEGRPTILTPRDTAWLQPGQCFVASDLTFEQLAAGNSWRQYSSLGQLIAGLQNPSLDFGAEVRVTVHARLIQPLLDLTLLFLGLPLALTRESRNIFVTAGLSMAIVATFSLVTIACHALGSSGYLLSPALAAWTPLIIFVPAAYGLCHPLWAVPPGRSSPVAPQN